MEITGYIKFIHSDNKEYHFVTERNNLNNSQMYSFNNWSSCFVGDLRIVKRIIKGLHEKTNVIESNI